MDADVIIVGGGLAGLTVAVRLTQRGKRVVLFEKRPVLGGRTSSWDEHGMKVESGLHRYLGFYRAMPKLIHDVGNRLDKVVLWQDEIEVRLQNSEYALGFSPTRKPMQTARTIFGESDFLTGKEKIALLGAAIPGIAQAVTQKYKLDNQDIASFMRARKVPHRVLERVVTPFSTGLFFLPPDAYSAYAFFAPFLPALLQPHRIGVAAFRGGMTDVLIRPIADWLRAHGAVIECNASADDLIVENGSVVGAIINGENVYAKHVVVASTVANAKRLLANAFPDHAWLKPFFELPTMPAVTAQFELRQRSLPIDRTTFAPDSRLACFSEQSRTTFTHVPGRLSVILANPESLMSKSPEEIARLVIDETKRLRFDISNIITDYRVIYQPNDFYHLGPGSESLRPSQKTPIRGLVLAGDYTQQPLLGSMEGAVISGNRAAKLIP